VGGAGVELHRLNANGNSLPGSTNVWAAICTSADTTITVTMSGGSTGLDRLTLLEFSGAADPVAEDGTSQEATDLGSPTAHDVSAVTPTADEVLFIAAGAVSNDPGTWTGDTDFTTYVDPNGGFQVVAYRIQTGTAAQSWTNTSANGVGHGLVLCAIQGSTGSTRPSVSASSIRSANFFGDATPIAVTAGDRIVVFFGIDNTAPPYPTPTDTQGNAYTQRASTGVGGLHSNCYTAVAGSTGTLTVHVNDGTSADHICAVVVAVSGADAAQASFITATGDGESTAPLADYPARSLTDSILLAFVAVASTSVTITPPSGGWDSAAPGYREIESGGSVLGAFSSRVVSDAADYDATFGLSGSLFWSVVGIEIKASGAGGLSRRVYGRAPRSAIG
jgi:hypothetical protein